MSLLKTTTKHKRHGKVDIPSFCRNAVRKAKADLKLKLARDVKNHKQIFFKYINNKEKQKENTGLLLNCRVNHSPTILNGMTFSKFLLCLYQPCWAPGLENSYLGWYKKQACHQR